MLMVITTHQTSPIFINNHPEPCTTPCSLKTNSVAMDLNHNFNYIVLIRACPLKRTLPSNAPFTSIAEAAILLFNHLTPDYLLQIKFGNPPITHGLLLRMAAFQKEALNGLNMLKLLATIPP